MYDTSRVSVCVIGFLASNIRFLLPVPPNVGDFVAGIDYSTRTSGDIDSLSLLRLLASRTQELGDSRPRLTSSEITENLQYHINLSYYITMILKSCT